MTTRAFAAPASNAAWRLLNLPRYFAFKRALQNPAATQEALLRKYIQRNAVTEFGKRHGFEQISSPAHFRQRVPLADYDSLASDIDRMARGDQNVLTFERVMRLSTSSGSTRARKLIPYTRGLQREFNRAIGPWIVDLFNHDRSLAGGCAYWSISPLIEPPAQHRNAGAPPIGFENDSSYLGGVAARLIDAVMAVPSCVRHLQEMADFRYVTARLLLGRADLRLISVWHPSFLELLLDTVNAHWPQLVEDIRHGTCTPISSRSKPIAEQIERTLRPDPARAVALQQIDPSDCALLWPHLRLVSCWADANAAGPAATLEARLGGVAIQAKGLLATEAFVTIPFQGRWPVAVASHYFEFLDADSRIHPCDALRDGEQYEVVVTTAGGLWRYRLGDFVRVEGHLGRTPSLRFVGRSDHVIDHFGEKLSDGFVSRAVRQFLATANVQASFSMLAPERCSGGTRYVLFLAAIGEHSLDDLARELDRELCENPHYRYCRALRQLEPPAIARVPANAWQLFLDAEVAAGRRLGDVKATALAARMDLRKVLAGDDIDVAADRRG